MAERQARAVPRPSLEHARHVDGFLAHLAVERGLARNSLEAYARDLARFVTHLERSGVHEPATLRPEHLRRFAEKLADEGLGPASRTRTLVAVRRFVRQGRTRADRPARRARPHGARDVAGRGTPAVRESGEAAERRGLPVATGHVDDAPELLRPLAAVGPAGRDGAGTRLAARAAPLVRDGSARGRRGPASRAGHARSRRSDHHSDLHSRE